MFPRLSQRLEGVGDGRRAGGHRQCRAAALQGRDAGLKYALGRVGQAAVNVARVAQAKAIRGVFAVMEHIRSSGVNRHRAGIGNGISLLLADVQLLGFKAPVGGILNIRHGSISFDLLFYKLEVLPGIEPGNKGFADLGLTWIGLSSFHDARLRSANAGICFRSSPQAVTFFGHSTITFDCGSEPVK